MYRENLLSRSKDTQNTYLNQVSKQVYDFMASFTQDCTLNTTQSTTNTNINEGGFQYNGGDLDFQKSSDNLLCFGSQDLQTNTFTSQVANLNANLSNTINGMGTANSVKYSTTAISNCVNDITKDSTFVSAQATINNTNLQISNTNINKGGIQINARNAIVQCSKQVMASIQKITAKSMNENLGTDVTTVAQNTSETNKGMLYFMIMIIVLCGGVIVVIIIIGVVMSKSDKPKPSTAALMV